MPFNQPLTANYFGFIPIEGDQVRARIYQVSSSEGSDINLNDLVVYATDKQTVRVASAFNDGGIFVGIAASRVKAGDGSTGADPRVQTSQTVLLWDDPNTLFVGCDTTSGVIGTAQSLGKSVQVLATGAVGSTGPNSTLLRSVMAISGISASSGSAATYRFRIVGMHPIDTGYSTATGAQATTFVRKWILKPDFHANAGYGIGYGHVTT